MSKKSTLVAAVVSAFRSHKDMHKTIAAQLPKLSAAERKAFVIDTANALAACSPNGMQTYDGQRGIAFGIWDAESGKMVRTPECNATREWFRVNVLRYFKPVTEPVAPSAIWSKIAGELTTIKTKARKLNTAEQRMFFARLAELEAEFFAD